MLSEETSAGLRLVNTSSDAGNGTDFETALTDGIAMIPPGHIPRIVLISDGNENEGSTPRAISQLQRLHVPVDTIPLSAAQDWPAAGITLHAA